MFSNAQPPSAARRDATSEQNAPHQRSLARLTSKVLPIQTRRADLQREVVAALCPAKRPAPTPFSNDTVLARTSKKGPVGQLSLSASVADLLRGPKVARAKPCPPPPRRSQTHRERSNLVREATRRLLSPWEPAPSPTVTRTSRVLIETKTGHRVENIWGPTRILDELTKQHTIIATVLTAARQPDAPP